MLFCLLSICFVVAIARSPFRLDKIPRLGLEQLKPCEIFFGRFACFFSSSSPSSSSFFLKKKGKKRFGCNLRGRKGLPRLVMQLEFYSLYIHTFFFSRLRAAP